MENKELMDKAVLAIVAVVSIFAVYVLVVG